MQLLNLILFFVIVLQTNCSERCITPKDEIGTCVDIKNCMPLLENLKRQPNNHKFLKFLINSNCGWDGEIPRVCCSNINDEQFKPIKKERELSLIINQKLPLECGFSDKPHLKGSLGPFLANQGTWPWVALLGYHSSNSSPVWDCGATLITNRHLLTAAQCVHTRKPYLVRLGEYNLLSNEESNQPIDIPISQVLIHPEYDSQKYNSDIALVSLKSPVSFTEMIHPVCLPTDPTLKNKTFEKTFIWIAGWEAVKYNETYESFIKESFKVIYPEERCKAAYSTFARPNIDNRIFCADGHRQFIGNPGYPAMAHFKRHIYTQIGIVSFGLNHDNDLPTIYTKVSYFLDWILNNI